MNDRQNSKLILPVMVVLVYTTLAFQRQVLGLLNIPEMETQTFYNCTPVIFYVVTMINAIYCVFFFKLKWNAALLVSVLMLLYLVFIEWIDVNFLGKVDINADPNRQAEMRDVYGNVMIWIFLIPYIAIWIVSTIGANFLLRPKSRGSLSN